MKVVVIGAAGHIGTYLVPMLVKAILRVERCALRGTSLIAKHEH